MQSRSQSCDVITFQPSRIWERSYRLHQMCFASRD